MKKLDYNAINWHQIVYYDETSSTFLRWKVDRRTGKGRLRMAAGDVAGYINNMGYSSTNRFRKQYSNHRIIWILFHGWIDHKLDIDHIDGNKSNNSIENLRLVTRTTNLHNSTLYCSNTSGITGVCLTGNGQGNHYYTAHWSDIAGKLNRKNFSITKLGETEAFRLACEYRTRMIEELNVNGAGYTDRHGT